MILLVLLKVIYKYKFHNSEMLFLNPKRADMRKN